MSDANNGQIGGDHYQTGEGKMQHWDWCWQQKYDQFQYCISKYVDRHKRKNGLQDLYKARHHLDKYIEVLEAEEKAAEQASQADYASSIRNEAD